MILPGIVLVLTFSYMPIYGMVIAFRKFDIVSGFFGGEWVGIKYFIQFFNDPYFFRLVRNTLLLNIYGLLWGMPAPIILALLLNEVSGKRFKKFVQSCSYLPYFISVVVVIGIMMQLFSYKGVINGFLTSLGINEQLFFSDPKWFRSLYIASGIWQGAGYSAIIYLAALSGINTELYESAVIDGANRWRQTLNITIPGIMPTITVILILNMGQMMNVGFDKVYLMQNPSIYETADVIATYVYRRGIINMDFSL